MKTKLLTSVLFLSIIQVGITAESDPGKLKGLRQSWHLAQKKAMSPINKKYLRALAKLKTEYTKSGQLQNALAVEAEITSLNGGSESQENLTKRQVFNKLVSSNCEWADGSPMKFNRNGSITSPHSAWLGPFEVRENGDFVVKHRSLKNKWVFRFQGNDTFAKAIKEKGTLSGPKTITIVSKR